MPKLPKPESAKPTPDALEGVIDATSPDAATAVADRPARSKAKKAAEPAPAKPKRNPIAEMKARMFDSKEPAKKPEPAAKAKPKAEARRAPQPEVDDEEEDDPIVGELPDDDDFEEEADDEGSAPARRGVAERRSERTAEIDDKLYEAGELQGYSRKDLRELAEELGGPVAVKKFLEVARRSSRRQDPESREEVRRPTERARETEQEETRHDDNDPSELRKELDALFAKFELSEEDFSESGLKLAERISSRHDGQGKAIVKALEGIQKRLDAFEADARQRAIAEMNRQFDESIKKLPPEWADVYGKVPTHRLPAESSLREQRNRLAQKMHEIQADRAKYGDPLLDVSELMDEALDLLHKDRLKQRAKEELEREQREVRGTRLPRANSRSGELPPGPEKARRNIGARMEKLFSR